VLEAGVTALTGAKGLAGVLALVIGGLAAATAPLVLSSGTFASEDVVFGCDLIA
jgi:hypothetical protein